MASEDKHEENLELLRGLNLPKKVRDKMAVRHLGPKPDDEDWNSEEDRVYDYPLTSSGPLCQAEESGYLDSEDVFCPFLSGPDYTCKAGCPTNRERVCILEEY